MKIKIYTEQRPWSNETAFWIVGEDASGRRFKVLPLNMIFEPHNDGEAISPTLVFKGPASRDILPALHDAIVESGFVPKDSSIDAIKYHLEDMRRLVFRKESGE